MERSEALLYLPLTDDHSVDDLYEQKLFEWKNFFVHRFPISKLFLKKLEQLEKLEKAYEVLGGSISEKSKTYSVNLQFEADLKQSFLQYAAERNNLKVQLYAANSAGDIIFIIQNLLKLTAAYAKVWNVPELDTNGVVVSKEVDPMDLLNAIKEAEEKGVTTIADIAKLNEGDMLLNEAKRLSLWTKMENG